MRGSGFPEPSEPPVGTALVIGVAGTLWSGMAVIRATEHALDTVWNLPRPKRSNLLFASLRALLMLGVLGLITVVSTGDGRSPGVSQITGEVAKMVAQVPELFETLTGMKVSELMGRLPSIESKPLNRPRDNGAPPKESA